MSVEVTARAEKARRGLVDMNLFGGYSHRHEPFGAYAGVVAVYWASLAAFLLAVRALGRTLPARIGAADLVLLGVATHKLSRTITRDRVTSVLRAPFVRRAGEADLPSEVSETARGQGVRRAIGQLLTCPFCTGQWVAALLVFGLVFTPRTARLVAGIFAVRTVADFLQTAWVSAATTMEEAGTPTPAQPAEPARQRAT